MIYSRFLGWRGRLSALCLAGGAWLGAAGPGTSALAAPPAAGIAHSVGTLRLIGVQSVSLKQEYQGTIIGGLSGLDYDPATDAWIAESDDKSEYSPARYYHFEIKYDVTRLAPVVTTGVTLFRQRDGSIYPSARDVATAGGEIPDLESIRFDPVDRTVWYSSEGSRKRGMNPFVRHADAGGKFLAELPMPGMFRVHADEERGPRDNLSFEGLAFAPDGRTLWLAMEAPLYEDGALATRTSGALARITHFGRDGRVLGQFVYPVDAIPQEAAPGKNADNGISELLAVSDHEFLVLERSGAQDAAGAYHFNIRLYDWDITGATDVSGLPSLSHGGFQAGRKRLVQDFGQLAQPWVDNLEGMTWGRQLANGHDSLVLVSDDNFDAKQQTQFWAFEMIPEALPASAIANRQWNQPFPGVVQNAETISGLVGEYSWLSNFFPCRVAWEGRIYESGEAAYQSAKYPAAERDVFTTLDPDSAKKLSRTRAYDTAAWELRKEAAMRDVVWAKFSQHPELAGKLLATGTRHLEETNWWGDCFWGVYQGVGKNVLGQILMETRTRLAQRAAAPR